MAGAKLFSKIDANSQFWQISHAKESRPLTTFFTPFGRYRFNKLKSPVPWSFFHRRMNNILEGVLCQMDDVLIFWSIQAEHDSRVIAVLMQPESRYTLESANSEKKTSQVHRAYHRFRRYQSGPQENRSHSRDESPNQHH